MTTMATSLPFAARVASAVGYAPPASGWAKCFDQLLALRSLADDWDGAGAVAPPPALIDSAVRLAVALNQSQSLGAPSRTVAGPDGTILFEWQEPGEYAEIEVAVPGEAEVMTVADGQPAVHTTIRW